MPLFSLFTGCASEARVSRLAVAFGSFVRLRPPKSVCTCESGLLICSETIDTYLFIYLMKFLNFAYPFFSAAHAERVLLFLHWSLLK